MYSNGHHQGLTTTHGDRVRRGNRRSREPLRVSDHSNQQQPSERKSSTPCTDFDVAYFNSYAHVGIHEEMIKVRIALYKVFVLSVCFAFNSMLIFHWHYAGPCPDRNLQVRYNAASEFY